jgi:hypothetical protein
VNCVIDLYCFGTMQGACLTYSTAGGARSGSGMEPDTITHNPPSRIKGQAAVSVRRLTCESNKLRV